MEPLLVSIHPEGSGRLGIGRTKMYALIEAGEIPTVTIGRRRLVPVAALEEYVERLMAGPSTAAGPAADAA